MFLLLAMLPARHSNVPFLTELACATPLWEVVSQHPRGTVQSPVTELSAPGNSVCALALSNGLMLRRRTVSALQVCQPRQSSTQLFRCSRPRAALRSPDIPTAIARSSEGLLHLPETQGKLTLAGFHPIVARLPPRPH